MPDTPPTRPAEDAGAIIRMLRESRDLSAAELGRLIGKSEPMVTAIERGERRASLAICVAVASALDIPVSRIVGDEVAAIIADEPARATS